MLLFLWLKAIGCLPFQQQFSICNWALILFISRRVHLLSDDIQRYLCACATVKFWLVRVLPGEICPMKIVLTKTSFFFCLFCGVFWFCWSKETLSTSLCSEAYIVLPVSFCIFKARGDDHHFRVHCFCFLMALYKEHLEMAEKHVLTTQATISMYR